MIIFKKHTHRALTAVHKFGIGPELSTHAVCMATEQHS